MSGVSTDWSVGWRDDGHGPTGSRRQPGRRGSLLPVIRVIPEAAYDNPTWKGLAYFARDLVIYGVVVRALVLTDNPFLLVALWVLAVAGGGRPVHHRPRRRPRGAVQVAAGSTRSSATSRCCRRGTSTRPGCSATTASTTATPSARAWTSCGIPSPPEQYSAMSTFGRLRHRVEWSWWGAGAYYLREIWLNKMITFNPPAKWAKAIRRDLIFMCAGVGLGMALFGWLGWAIYGSVAGVVWMIVKVVVIPFLGFNFVIGSVVHVHHVQPDIRWYPRREWTKFRGQMEGTTILRAPAGARPVLPLDLRAHPAPRGHAHPVLRARAGGRGHQGRVPRHHPRRAAALPRLRAQQPPVQALRLRRGRVDDLRRRHDLAGGRRRPTPPMPGDA